MHQMRRAKPAEFWETHIKKWKSVKNEPKSEYCKRHGLLETHPFLPGFDYGIGFWYSKNALERASGLQFLHHCLTL
jgi:hypothetical protein